MRNISGKDYYSKVYGGWLGKNIGGTLGLPFEGFREILDLRFYDKSFDGPVENDDLDLQLVWLHTLEQYGVGLTSMDLAKEWLAHVFFCFDEYGYCLSNLRRGLVPPVSGSFDNLFVDCMGSPIRSEIWAMVAPGCPELAAYYAYQDAIVDHAGGEGVYGEMFFAALESAAFFERDKNKLLDSGMAAIPPASRTARAILDLRNWYEQGKDWMDARNLILMHHDRPNFTDAPQNIAFTVLGLLYGQDFGDSICKAVNCAYDTDCTGATLGAILGIMGGRESLPSKWIEPIGDKIKVSKVVNGFNTPSNLDELTDRTVRAGRKVLSYWDAPVHVLEDGKYISDREASKDDSITDWSMDFKSRLDHRFNVNQYILPAGSISDPDMEVWIDYGSDGPSIGKNQAKELIFRVRNLLKAEYAGTLEVVVPQGWKTRPPHDFTLRCGESLEWKTTVTSDDKMDSGYMLQFCINRFNNQSPWATETIPFSLIASEHWRVRVPGDKQEKLLVCPGTRVEFDRVTGASISGEYCARTTLAVPSGRHVRLIAATQSHVKVTLDGGLVFDESSITEFMPAYHRSPESKRAEFFLAAGRHTLEVAVVKGDEDLQLSVLFVEASNYGNNNFYTDITFE